MTTTEYHLPKVIKVETATVNVPFRIEVDTLNEYERVQREITHLLALIPDEDKADATIEDNGIYIRTDSLPAIRYANERYLLNEVDTCIDNVIRSVVEYYDGQVCDSCIDGFVEQAMDTFFEVVTLTDGLVISFSDEPTETPVGAVA